MMGIELVALLVSYFLFVHSSEAVLMWLIVDRPNASSIA